MNILILSTYENKIGIGQALNISLTGILVVFIILIILAVLVSLMSKFILKFTIKKEKIVDKTSINSKIQTQFTEPQIELIDVDEKTAAVIMAIVSNESEIPIDCLKFNYIKLVKEENNEISSNIKR